MANRNHQSIEKIEALKEEAETYKKESEALLQEHLKEEKVLRIKRYKLETLLSNLMIKYDNDIGEINRKLEIEEEG